MGEGSVSRTQPCKWCGVPVPQPPGWWRGRRYCSKRHRRWYRFLDAVLRVLDNV
ncbi:hypothetical protein PV379_41665 [Streptomyces caniscabiei]|uniref:hypothetical protein n=1 Tax=Streptomyces caniscabiei TaxID=2746961 RepID=UPI0029A4EF58|nr:hypothetical protein [Streptomyces caniscabiei]MDX2783773.1 hypothetical protein [Streptomyces caniscabiei]